MVTCMTLNWETPAEHEKPFWRDGMTPEEYDIENEYLGRNYHRFLDRTYVPLWKQKGEFANVDNSYTKAFVKKV